MLWIQEADLACVANAPRKLELMVVPPSNAFGGWSLHNNHNTSIWALNYLSLPSVI